MTTKAQREKWARLAREAPDGPWDFVSQTVYALWWRDGQKCNRMTLSVCCDRRSDDSETAAAAFIAASREAVPALLEENARFRALLRRARVEMDHMLWCAERDQPPHDGDDFHQLYEALKALEASDE